MFKDFTVWQIHTPNKIASMYFGGCFFKYEGHYPNTTIQYMKHYLLNAYAQDEVYTNKIVLPDMIKDAKQYSMKLVIGMNESHGENNPLVTPEVFGMAAGVLADIFDEEGFDNESAGLNLINEPRERWKLNVDPYVDYVISAAKHVNGRYPIIIYNEETHFFPPQNGFGIHEILKAVIKRLQNENIPAQIVIGVHHLSSLGYPPKWKNLIDAKTIANEYAAKYPEFGFQLMANEVGSWFKSYRENEGHQINIDIIKKCKELGYVGAGACMVEGNLKANKMWPKLCYRIWSDNYSGIKIQNNWPEFENEIKKYRKEGEEPMPEDRLIKKTQPPMAGTDVKILEDKLREIGFDTAEDSTYTDNDYRGVRVFQEIAGIVIDGVVGPQTRGKLDEYNAGNFMPEVFQNIYSSRQYSIELLDYFLENYAIVSLKNHGQYFNQAEIETGIPAEWLLGKAWQESGERDASGKFLLGNSYYGRVWKNLFGYGITDSGPMPEYKFETYREGILIVAREIKNLFLDPENWRYHGDSMFGIDVRYSTACYNAIRKAQYYRQVCQILDAGIMHPMPKFIEQLLPVLDKYYKRID